MLIQTLWMCLNMSTDLKRKAAHLRREHILDASIRVFDASGYRGATIRDIATEAGVADGTVYNVFENKEAILLGVLGRLLTASQSADGAQPSKVALDQTDLASLLRGMLTARWKDLTPDVLAMMRIVWSEALCNRKLARQYRDQILAPTLEAPHAIFKHFADRGSLAATDVQTTLRIIVASFLGLGLLKMLGDDHLEDHSDEIPDQLADLILNGLLPRRVGGENHGIT
jgi:AcrR family transcriptional regulator